MYFEQANYSQNPFDRIYVAVGPMMIRVLETNQKSCTANPFNLDNFVCYEDQYNAETEVTNSSNLNWRFNTSEENKIYGTVLIN